jgi:capsular polysaccharide biosynthesis protein
MRLRVSLLILLAALTLSACHGSHVYSATAVIEIKPRYLVSLGSGSSGVLTNAEAQNEFEVIGSPDVLSPVITDLQLDRIWAKQLNKGNALPMQDALAYFSAHLRLDYKPGTNIISITATADNPKEATDMANAVANKYKAMRDKAEDQLSEEGMNALRDQIAQQEKIVADASAAAAKIRRMPTFKRKVAWTKTCWTLSKVGYDRTR